MDHRAKCQSNDRRRKSFRRCRPKLEGRRFRPQLVGHRLLRRRNQIGGGRQQRIHLDFDQFRRDMDTAKRQQRQRQPLLVFRRLFCRWNPTGGGSRLYHLHHQPARCHLHFNRFRCDLGVANFFAPVCIHELVFRGFFRRWNQTRGGGSDSWLDLHFLQLRLQLDRAGAKWSPLDFRRLFGRRNQTGGGGE